MRLISELLQKQEAVRALTEICQDFNIDQSKVVDFDIDIKCRHLGYTAYFDYPGRMPSDLSKPVVYVSPHKCAFILLYHELGHLIDYSLHKWKYPTPDKIYMVHPFVKREMVRKWEAIPDLLGLFYKRKYPYFVSENEVMTEKDILTVVRYGYVKRMGYEKKSTEWIKREVKRTLETGYPI